jgi:putative ABC transport system ATP-binding protein
VLEARGIGRLRTGDGGWLLDDVSLTLAPGETVVLAGPSGAGKTLLLRALALLDPIDRGAVYWRGRAVRCQDVPGHRARVMYLPQRAALFEGSVEDNLRVPFTLGTHRAARYDRDRALATLAALGREPGFLAQSHRDLSGGEAQITALLRALQLDPEALLLDEPTSALDRETALGVEGLLGRWVRAAGAGRSLLWVTHDAGQAGRVADRRLRLERGRLTAGG